mmetsp:Transcript_19775/g.27598  ORF Transcript_19775/g.27598 Transcript_19775/m.27598 type:complete len:346 (+) Transcript_19775:26-1063(+)
MKTVQVFGFYILFSVFLGLARCDSWVSSTNLLQPRTGAALVTISQTNFAVIGGLASVNSTNPLTSVEVFNVTSLTWSNTTIPPLPIGLAYASAAFDQSRNCIWVVGGYTNNFEIVPYLFKYNFTSSWFQHASLPSARVGMSTMMISNNLYVFGGLGNFSYEAQTFVYSPVGDIWETRASLGYPRAFLAGILGPGNLAYLIGGRNPDNLKIVERYSAVSDTFEQISSMPSPRSGASVAIVQNRILVFGGVRNNILNATEEYSPNDNLWFCRTGMNISREDSNAVGLGAVAYVVGGETSQGVTGAMEVYTPATATEAGLCPVESSSSILQPILSVLPLLVIVVHVFS